MNGWAMCIMHGKITRYDNKKCHQLDPQVRTGCVVCGLLDLKILFLTVKKVFVREGISQEGQATMSYFDGTN